LLLLNSIKTNGDISLGTDSIESYMKPFFNKVFALEYYVHIYHIKPKSTSILRTFATACFFANIIKRIAQ